MGSRDNKLDDVMNVCRLCLGTDSLICVFDDRIETPQNMKDVIQVTTGITITPNDNVSQSLCYKCLHITIRMFKFRTSSIVNDMELKAKASRKLKPLMHKSIEALLNKYPKIVLPSSITKVDVSPVVIANENEVSDWVENYKKRRKLERRNRRKQLKLAEKLLANKNVVHESLENEIITDSIVNQQMPAESRPPLLTPEFPIQKLQIPKTSPILPKLFSQVDGIQESSHRKSPISHVSNDKENSSTVLHPSLPIDVKTVAKRKLSLSLNSPEAKKLKTAIDTIESDDSADSLVTVKYFTKSLFICDICNSILYSAKDLKKHKMKHMRCILCKTSFRSMEETKDHSENSCTIKHIMNNLPNIYLIRCDQLREIRDRYPSAFETSFHKEIESVVLGSDSLLGLKDKSEEPIMDPLAIENIEIKKPLPSPESKSEEQIEILLISDDEDLVGGNDTKNSNDNSKLIPSKDQSNKTKPSCNDKSKSSLGKSDGKLRKELERKTADIPSSTSSIKPNIEIVGENILDVDLDDSEISLLKNILMRTRQNSKEISIQTDMPSSKEIIPSLNKDKLFELKNLRKYLNFYKIPVNVSYAPQYSVRYGFDSSPLLKKDRCWSKINTKSINNVKAAPAKKDIPQNNTERSIELVSETSGVIKPTQIVSDNVIESTRVNSDKVIESAQVVSNKVIKSAQATPDKANKSSQVVPDKVIESAEVLSDKVIKSVQIVSDRVSPTVPAPSLLLVQKPASSTVNSTSTFIPLTNGRVCSVVTASASNVTGTITTNNSSHNNGFSIGAALVPTTNYCPPPQTTYCGSLPSNHPAQNPTILNYQQSFLNNLANKTSSVQHAAGYQVPQPNIFFVLPNTSIVNSIVPSPSACKNTSPSTGTINTVPSSVNNYILPKSITNTIPLTAGNKLASLPDNTMPPPSNTFVPQRPQTVIKTGTGDSQVLSSSLYTTTDVQAQPPTSTRTGGSNYVPMIRVKNVSELR